MNNTIKIGRILVKTFPSLADLKPGQMFLYPNGSEAYFYCGVSSQTKKHLVIQLKNGRRMWFSYAQIVNVDPLPKGTRLEITQG